VRRRSHDCHSEIFEVHSIHGMHLSRNFRRQPGFGAPPDEAHLVLQHDSALLIGVLLSGDQTGSVAGAEREVGGRKG
jgi:hypothetical protein